MAIGTTAAIIGGSLIGAAGSAMSSRQSGKAIRGAANTQAEGQQAALELSLPPEAQALVERALTP